MKWPSISNKRAPKEIWGTNGLARGVDFIRSLIISVEFVLLLLGILLCVSGVALPACFKGLSITEEKIKWAALVPIALLALTVRDSRKILFPEKDKGDLVQKWPEYWKLNNITLAAVFYAVIFAGLGISSWFLDGKQDFSTVFYLLITAFLGAGCTYLTVYRAEIIVNILFAAENGDTHSRGEKVV